MVGKNVVGREVIVGRKVVGLNVGLLSTGDPVGADDATIGGLVIVIVIGSTATATGAPVGTRERGGTGGLVRRGFDFSDFTDFSNFTGLFRTSGTTDVAPLVAINLSDLGDFEPPLLNVR
jgi:hypothetical protein